MKDDKKAKGHICALITILIWGTAFISTKILLMDFKPIEIIFCRFSIGLLALSIIYPYKLKDTTKKQELMFAVAGLCGITFYFLLENIALTYTVASNVGVIISTAPFFTAILTGWLLDNEKPGWSFFIGFSAALTGIFLISFSGITMLELNPIGDLLAFAAAFVWAVYCILSRKISRYGYNTIQTTRRIFWYGLFFMIPVVIFFDFNWTLARFTQPRNIFNILFLGLGASALCFVTWNQAVKMLGAVKTSIYIYIVPVITMITSVIVLHDRVTWMSAIGVLLTLAGLLISDKKSIALKRSNNNGRAS